MKIYISKTRDTLCGKHLYTEYIHDRICVNPVYATRIHRPVKILLDSGGFQDRVDGVRLTFHEALQRQLVREKKCQVQCERIVAYDKMDDRSTTIDANKYLISRRQRLSPRQLVLMLQGEDTQEYWKCTEDVLKLANVADCIGFGGFAAAGRIKFLEQKLLELIYMGIFEKIKEAGIQDVHFFGIATFRLLKEIENHNPGLNFSCDSSSFERLAVMGKVFNPETSEYVHEYTKSQKFIDYHPRDLTHKNIFYGVEIIENL